MSDSYDGDSGDYSDSSTDMSDSTTDTTDSFEGTDIDAAESADLEAAGIEPSDDWFDNDVDMAPGNEGLDTKTGAGWGVEYHGQTEVDGELTDVTFNMKSNEAGEVTDVLVSPGHNTRSEHDANHAHAWGQGTDNPGHDDRGHRVLDE